MPRPPLSPRYLSALSLPSLSSFLPSRRLSTSSPSLDPAPTSPPPPGGYKLFLGASFRGKPEYKEPPPQVGQPVRRRPAKMLQGFAKDSEVAKWRDEWLEGKGYTAGHDWFFVVPEEGREGGAGRLTVGIADGVGGWEDSGVDPAHFAQGLMYHGYQAAKASGEVVEPREVLEAAFEGVTNEKAVLAGSSTACIATVDAATGLLRAANLGDSTFFIVRGGKTIHAQPSQTHFFNAPRQLSKLPPRSRSDGSFGDYPKDADLFETTLQEDDVLVLATDGFSDNVWPHELEQLVSLVFEKRAPVGERTLESEAVVTQLLSDSCVGYARVCAFKTDKESPFEHEARRYGHRYPGGKVDDITVLAVLVGKDPTIKAKL